MVKVLILAYDFPPYVSVGGLRPYNWYRYLNEYGIYPIVVTRQWGNEHGNKLDYIAAGTSDETIIEKTDFGTLLRTPYRPNLANRIMLKHGEHKYRILRKGISFIHQITQHLVFKGPKSELYREANKFLKTEKVDIILATGDPFILFKYASRLSKQHSIPWIADYRDLWVGHGIIGRKLIPILERKYLKNVHSISTVSTFLKNQIKKNIPNKQFHIQLNGYNPEAIDSVKNTKQNSEVLTISISGTIYPWHPLEGFLSNCEQFVQSNPKNKLRIKFYGSNKNTEITELVREKFIGLAPMLEVFPKLQNDELVKEIAKDNLFLLFNDYTLLGTKIFDYIGVQRMILLCFSKDEDGLELKRKHFRYNNVGASSKQLQEEAIVDTQSGIIVRDGAHLQAVLHEMNTQFLKDGFIPCGSINSEAYSRKLQIEQLAEHIRESI